MNNILLFICSGILLCSILDAQSISVKPSTTVFVFPNGVSVPSDYPHVKITVNNNPDSGYIFINNWGGTPYIAILDNTGSPVFYRKMPAYARDFKLQHNGMLSYRLADGYWRFYEMDSSYAVTREVKAGPGYETDEHELQLLPNGNALLIALDYRTVDMSKLVPGGNSAAKIVGNTVQEIDRAGNVLFSWKSWDHFNIVDAVHENLTAARIDYVHMNSISVDSDSNILISSRHLSEITKIDRKTGAIIWRLGGKYSQFNFINDPYNGPSYQHDVRALGNGRYTMMDNGNFHSQYPPYPSSFSRAVEYEIDTVAKTATLVWQYRHTPDRYSWWMGNVQRLPNGNTLINWADGALPKLTEVTPDGTKAMELGFVKYAHSYRVFRFPWKGKAKAPVLILEPGTDKITLLINKFDHEPGHTFIIYADTLPNPNRIADSTSLTAVDLTGFANGKRYYFRVTAKDGAGKESPYSNEENALIRIFKPGENLVVNGDFSNGTSPWAYIVTSPGAGVPFVTATGELMAVIGNGGTQTWHIQLAQDGIAVINGLKYRFEFDAYAAANRTIDPRVVMAAAPNTNYSKTGSVSLTTVKKHFTFDFTMQDPTDYNARVLFNCGLSDIDVFFDNVSVKQIVPVGVKYKGDRMPDGFSIQQNFPNPFNPSTTLRYGLPTNCRVKLQIYDLLGQVIAELVNKEQAAGWHSVEWSPSLSTGLYFCRIEAADIIDPNNRFVQVRKMLLMK